MDPDLEQEKKKDDDVDSEAKYKDVRNDGFDQDMVPPDDKQLFS